MFILYLHENNNFTFSKHYPLTFIYCGKFSFADMKLPLFSPCLNTWQAEAELPMPHAALLVPLWCLWA